MQMNKNKSIYLILLISIAFIIECDEYENNMINLEGLNVSFKEFNLAMPSELIVYDSFGTATLTC